MSDMTRRRQGEMVCKVFEILLAHPDGLAAKDVLTATAAGLTLSPFEATDYPNRPGVRRFDKIVRFSTIPFVKAGWLTKTKGTWPSPRTAGQPMPLTPILPTLCVPQ